MFEYFCDEPNYAESTVAFYMEQILQGLQFLHAKGIIHLDIKVIMFEVKQLITLFLFLIV